MGAHFEALDEGILLVPLDPRYTQVGFNLIYDQVCIHYRSCFDNPCFVFQARAEREAQRMRMLTADPMDAEAQRLIAQEIENKNIEQVLGRLHLTLLRYQDLKNY